MWKGKGALEQGCVGRASSPCSVEELWHMGKLSSTGYPHPTSHPNIWKEGMAPALPHRALRSWLIAQPHPGVNQPLVQHAEVKPYPCQP